MIKFSIAKASAMALGVFIIGSSAYATEGGGSIYPHGVENFMVGALPPPGLYGLVYGNYYTADRVNDNNGDKNTHVPPDFKVRALSITPRVAWVPGVKVFGGDLVLHAILPLVDLKVTAGGASHSKTGLADMTTGIGVGYHHSKNLHTVMAVNGMWPTGAYRNLPGEVNIGTNHTAIEPVYIVSYIDPVGMNADARIGYIINQTNRATDYKSGQELHVDYSVGLGLGNGWTAGLGGYYLQQTTNDSQAGAEVKDHKSRAFAIGPSIKFDSGQGWFLTAKWEKEMMVRNRTEGNELWLRGTFHF